LLLVDASQGIQAQTISNMYLALENDLEIIPVLNKVDMESAMIDEVSEQIIDLLGCQKSDILHASGKTGMGVHDILEAIIERIPAPKGDPEAPLQALIFDSVFNSYRGVIAYFRVRNGVIKKGDRIQFMNTKAAYNADEVGVLKMDMLAKQEIKTGDVGYVVTGIKNAKDIKVGDTITHLANPAAAHIDGFENVKPMVFAGIFPVENDDFEELRDALEKLQLNDASLTFEPETSQALGFGFRCGFLGLLHLDIVQERLDREYDQNIITTIPNVSYFATLRKGERISLTNPADMPDPTHIESIEEPYIRAQVITATEYVGAIMNLAVEKRGILRSQNYLTPTRLELTIEMPLAEIVFDFYDRLKSISRGYASFDYTMIDYRVSDLVRLDIKLNGENLDALSALVHRTKAETLGRRMCAKLKDLLSRHQFVIAIQAAIGAKIIARETLSALRKDVTAKCYGGDISRKRKLLDKQKEGKKRMRQFGNVEVPQRAFLDVLKLD
jgi:GTP-binding protein LepA